MAHTSFGTLSIRPEPTLRDVPPIIKGEAAERRQKDAAKYRIPYQYEWKYVDPPDPFVPLHHCGKPFTSCGPY